MAGGGLKGKLEGFDEAYKMLKTLPMVTQKNTLRRALQPAAHMYKDKMYALAPEEEGNLKASIKIDQRPKLTRSVSRSKKKAGDKSVETHVIADDPAAIRQEFGTTFHPAQPFGIPAYMSTRQAMIDVTAEAVKLEVGGAIARQAKKAKKL